MNYEVVEATLTWPNGADFAQSSCTTTSASQPEESTLYTVLPSDRLRQRCSEKA
jgi:hypothetical protein